MGGIASTGRVVAPDARTWGRARGGSRAAKFNFPLHVAQLLGNVAPIRIREAKCLPNRKIGCVRIPKLQFM